MPIYSYICKDCKEKFDLLAGVTSEKTELKCKKCGSKNIEKTFASFSVGDSSNSKSKSSGSSCSTGTCPTCF
ncbi:MAG: zinc ribbon domain-containing protein [Candidatus Omnitrophota bacterium]|nr:zinc ribbon domain-containing protein [Candidatus Omnitrophota bacterium]